MRRAQKSDASPLKDLENQLEAAGENLVRAEQKVKDTLEAYSQALNLGRDAAMTARREREEAEVERDIAERAIETLKGHIEAARESQAAAEVERLTAEARERIAAFEAATLRELPLMASTARRLVRLWAEASLARGLAVKAGADSETMSSVEEFRQVSGLPRQILETKRITRWINPSTGDAISDEQAAKAVEQDGKALLGRVSDALIYATEKAEFDRIVYLEAEAGPRLKSLVQALTVPGLMADDATGWAAPDPATPHAVLAYLDTLENLLPPDRSDQRERQVELRRVRAPAAGS